VRGPVRKLGAVALHKRGGIYHYHFSVDGTRYRGSTKKANLAAARRVESPLLAQAEEKGDVVLRKRSPLLRDFKTRFLEWVEGNTTLKQKTKDYYENGWRLLEQADVTAMRLNAITKHDGDRLSFRVGVVIDLPENVFRSHRPFRSRRNRGCGAVRLEWNLVALLQRPPERASPSASVVVQFLRPSAAHRKSIVHRRYVLLVSQFPRRVASAR